MTEDEIEFTEEVEETYERPEYRYVGSREFLEGEVSAFLEHGTEDGDYYEYGDHHVAREVVDSLVDHDSEKRVQIDIVEGDDE